LTDTKTCTVTFDETHPLNPAHQAIAVRDYFRGSPGLACEGVRHSGEGELLRVSVFQQGQCLALLSLFPKHGQI
jgi:hypothetical protein